MPRKPAVAKTKIKVVKGNLVLVKWKDACTRSGWHDLKHFDTLTPIDVTSVGWVTTHNREHLTILQSVAENDDGMSALSIPTPWITRITKLR